jgi:hypothetical protein
MTKQRKSVGVMRWAVAEGYIPAWSHGPEPEMASHETLCILNASDRPAHLSLTTYFKDREPAGPFRITVEPRRTQHVRMNELNDPEPIPRGTDYSTLIESDEPVVVQHSRLDSRQSENALISTMAYPLPE